MPWDVLLSSRAERALGRVPKRDQQRIDQALLQMRQEPLAGDVVPLKGKYQGTFRRRVGTWRIFFAITLESRVVFVHDIRRRTSSTY